MRRVIVIKVKWNKQIVCVYTINEREGKSVTLFFFKNLSNWGLSVTFKDPLLWCSIVFSFNL